MDAIMLDQLKHSLKLAVLRELSNSFEATLLVNAVLERLRKNHFSQLDCSDIVAGYCGSNSPLSAELESVFEQLKPYL